MTILSSAAATVTAASAHLNAAVTVLAQGPTDGPVGPEFGKAAPIGLLVLVHRWRGRPRTLVWTCVVADALLATAWMFVYAWEPGQPLRQLLFLVVVEAAIFFRLRVGVAAGPLGPEHPGGAGVLYREADARLYAAKSLGRAGAEAARLRSNWTRGVSSSTARAPSRSALSQSPR